MPHLIVARKTVADLYADAIKEMDHEAAVAHVARVCGQAVETVEAVIAEEATA